MDRLLGRNEGSESRDFTDGRRYGEDQRYYDDAFNDSGSEWNQNSEFSNRSNYRDDRNYRTQASRTRPRPGQYKSDYERDYNVRHHGSDNVDYNVRENDDDTFYSERERGFGRRFDRNDSFAPGEFRNTDYGNASMRREGSPGIFRDRREGQENRGFFGKGPKGWKWSDERIRDQVSEALYRDYHVDASEIEVEVKEGVVTLSGTVDSRESKRAAEECIENLSGVTDVHNRIRIMDKNNVSNLRSDSSTNEKRSLS